MFTKALPEDRFKYVVRRIESDGRTVDQHPATVEETRAYFSSLYNNLAIKVEKVNTNPNGNGNVVVAQAEVNTKGNNDSSTNCSKKEAGIQLQAKEFDLMAAVANLDEIKEVNANCILISNLQ
nr:hypothetical protein [Tanacetum cinerariifolium]